MKKTIGMLLLGAVVFAAAVLIPAPPAARSQPKPAPPKALLTVCQDESSLEDAIDRYLQAAKGIAATRRFDDPKKTDLVLVYRIGPENCPDLAVTVDTTPMAKDEKGKVIERAVVVQTYCDLPASTRTAAARRTMLEMNNKYMAAGLIPESLYVDDEGSLCLRTTFNIAGPEVTLHAEMVFDAIARLNPFWAKYYPDLKKALNLPDKTEKEGSGE